MALADRGTVAVVGLLCWEGSLDMLRPEGKRRPLVPVERGVMGGGAAAVCAITRVAISPNNPKL